MACPNCGSNEATLDTTTGGCGMGCLMAVSLPLGLGVLYGIGTVIHFFNRNFDPFELLQTGIGSGNLANSFSAGFIFHDVLIGLAFSLILIPLTRLFGITKKNMVRVKCINCGKSYFMQRGTYSVEKRIM